MTRSFARVGFLAAAAYLVAVFYFGTVPQSGIPGVDSDKAAHALCFFGMVLVSFPAALALVERRPQFARHVEAWTAAYAILIGGVLELVQAGLPTRHAELADLAANTGGAALAFLLLRGVRGWTRQAQS